MICYQPKDLPDTNEELTIAMLLTQFTEDQIKASTYNNRLGETFIRLINSYEELAQTPALYSYSKSLIEELQQTYSNVTTFNTDGRAKKLPGRAGSRKLDVLIKSHRLHIRDGA